MQAPDQQNPQGSLIHYPGPCPTLKEAETSVIQEALKRAEGNQGVAADLLGISRQALNRRLARMFTQGGKTG